MISDAISKNEILLVYFILVIFIETFLHDQFLL